MPGTKIKSMRVMEGSFSNFTHLVEVEAPGAGAQQIVLRRYNPDNGHMALKAAVEYNTLAWLYGSGIPVAQPLHLDADGALLGLPGFAMRFVPGRLVLWPDNPPHDPLSFARKAAVMLARIHALPCDPMPSFLLDGNEWALWFMRSGTIPGYLQAYPQGPAVWKAIVENQPDFQQSKNALHHGDFWEGNLLWDGDEISAVLDWEEAGYGEPGADVAYFMMGMTLVGHPKAADAFLQAYETAAGNKVEHLAFWKLVEAVRPIYRPDGWIDAAPFRERFQQFVTAALSQI